MEFTISTGATKTYSCVTKLEYEQNTKHANRAPLLTILHEILN